MLETNITKSQAEKELKKMQKLNNKLKEIHTKTENKMSTLEMKGALRACKLFLEEYEIEERKDKGRCKRFFDIIKHVRLCLQVTTELLKRIESLEEQINNLKIE